MSYEDDVNPQPKTRKPYLKTKETQKPRDEMNGLALGVIRQAFLDIFEHLEQKDKPNSELYYDEACSWLMSEEEYEDLKFWCDKAGITVDGIRVAKKRFEGDVDFRRTLMSTLGIHKVY